MRLRDTLATAAMQAMLSRASIAELEITDGYSADECAQDAYIYADAMLRERKLKRQRAAEHRNLAAIIAAKKNRHDTASRDEAETIGRREFGCDPGDEIDVQQDDEKP